MLVLMMIALAIFRWRCVLCGQFLGGDVFSMHGHLGAIGYGLKITEMVSAMASIPLSRQL